MGMAPAPGYPVSGDTIRFNNQNAPALILTAPKAVGSLEMSKGTINLNGNLLGIDGVLNITGGSLLNGTVEMNEIKELKRATFSNMTFTKSGNSGDQVCWGGNTFNGNTIFTISGFGGLTMSHKEGDTYNGTVAFNNLGVGALSIAARGNSVFNGNINLEHSITASGIIFGENGGASTIAAGGRIIGDFLTSQVNPPLNSVFQLDNVTQLGTAVNEILTPTFLTVINSSFGGTFNAEAFTAITLDGSTFDGGGIFTAPDIDVSNSCSFGEVTGTTTFTKTGGGLQNWEGGNTFGEVTFNNDSDELWRLANVFPDQFQGNTTFNNNATGRIQVAYQGNNIFEGNITVSGAVDQISFTPATNSGNGVVVIAGNQPQSVNNTGVALNIYDLEMNTSGELTLNGPIRVGTNLILTQGIINTDNSTELTLTANAVTTIGSSTSYVNGPMRYVVNSSVANTSRNFPVGRSGSWRPFILTLTHSNVGNVQYFGEVINSSAADLGRSLPGTVDRVSDIRYWKITRDNSAVTTNSAEVELFYGTDTGDGVVNGSELVVVRSDIGGAAWEDLGGPGSGAPAGSITSGAFTNFGLFTLGNITGGANPLPVELLYFTATPEPAANRVRLDWATATELNHAAFFVERSAGGKQFEAIEKIAGDGRDRQETKTYQLLDAGPLPGLSYYRLKQVDLDGTVTYSEVRTVLMDAAKSEGGLTLFPNPAREKVILLAPGKLGNAQLHLYDLAGRQVPLHYRAQDNQVELSISHLPAGLYLLRLTNAGETMSRRLLIER